MAAEKVSSLLESAEWGRSHWYLFIAVSLNYLLDGVVFALAPLIAVVVAPEIAAPIFASNLLAETMGAVFFGYLADKRGRKFCLILINLIQALATSLLFFFYWSPMALWVLTSLLSFSVGGDFGASYAALAEVVPARLRGRAILLSTNFWNIGSAAISGAALFFKAIHSDPLVQTRYILLSAMSTLGLVAVIRLTMPESPRWLLHRGKSEEAVRLAAKIGAMASASDGALKRADKPLTVLRLSYPYRFAVLAVATVSQYVTYGMMAYYAPYAPGFAFGVDSAPTVIFVANLGASLGALFLCPIIDRNRRVSALLSFLFGTVLAAVIYAFHGMGEPLLFYVALFVCLIFSEWAWGSVSALQSELFPTGLRATSVGLLTGLTGVSGAVVVLTQSIFTADQFLAVSVILWAAGLSTMIAWIVRGIETAGKAVDELDAEIVTI